MPCGASLSDPGMQILYNIAASSGGTVFFANPQFSGQGLLSIPATYAKSYVYQNFVADCSNGSTFYFPIESETQTIQVSVYGDLNSDVTYMAPDNSIVNVSVHIDFVRVSWAVRSPSGPFCVL